MNWSKVTHSFCKLTHFMKANTCQLLNKNCLDSKEVYKFNPKLQYSCREKDFVLEQEKTK
jgi:hypothetical protein